MRPFLAFHYYLFSLNVSIITVSFPVSFFLQILALEDFNAPFKKKTYITSPHGHRENLESKTWKHVSTYPHRMKNQMSNTMNSYFIINFLNICALVLIRARKIKNKQTFFSLLREWLGHFQDFSPILRIWNVLKMEDKHLLQVQKCGSWGFTKWTPYCKMCKKNHLWAMLWKRVP